MAPQPRIIDEASIDAALDERIRHGLCTCFPADREVFSHTRAWHGSAPAYSVVIERDDEIIAHAGIVDRTITAGQTTLRVAGIQNVFVLPRHRGSGFVYVVMTQAMDEAARRGFDCGLLFCVPELEKLYQRCGWRTLDAREVVRIDETGHTIPLPGKNIAMFHPLRVTEFPPGPMHLRGNDW